MRSPGESGGDADTAMEHMRNLRMDAPISDNSVSTTCGGPSGADAAAAEWCVDGVSVEEDYSSSDLMPPHAVAVGVAGGSFYETAVAGAAVHVKSGKSSIKSRIKSGVKSATSWIPKVFGSKGGQAVGGSQNQKSDTRSSSKKEAAKSAFVRQGSTSSSVSAYSSLACSVSGSQTSTSYTTSGAAATAGQMTRCASYDPIYLSSRRSSTSSITTSSESPATAFSQCKARHLSQTTNLIVQPQSVALSSAISSAISSEGYGSSLSTLNSSSSLPFAASSVDPVRSDTGSGSNSTTTTVTTQIHHPNENVVLDECDSDQPIEYNRELILPDDVMRYLKESSECKPVEEVKGSSEINLPASDPMANIMPPGPVSPNSSVTQPSPSSVMATAAPFDTRLTNLSNYSVRGDQPPFSPMQQQVEQSAVVAAASNPIPAAATTSFGIVYENYSKAAAAPSLPPPYPQTQQPYHSQHELQLQQQQQQQQQQHQFLRQQHQVQNFCPPPNQFQVPNQIQMQQYAARSQAMTGTSHGAVHGYSGSHEHAVSYNYMQQSGGSQPLAPGAAMPAHFNRPHHPSDTNFSSPQTPQSYPHTAVPHDNRAAYCFGMSHHMDQFYNNNPMLHPSPSNNPGTSRSSSSLLHANMVVNDLSTAQAALIEETRFLKHQQIPG